MYVYMYIIVTKQHTCISVLPQTKNEQWFCYKDQEQALLNLLDFLYHEHTLLSFSAVNSILQEWQPNDYDACKFSKHSMQNIPVKDKLSQLDEIFIMLKEFSKNFLRK